MDSRNVTPVVLSAGAIASTLAYGGVDTLAFAGVQIAVVIFALFQFWRNGFPRIPRLTLLVLVITVAVPLLQLFPLPIRVISAVSPARVSFLQALSAPIAFAVGKCAITFNFFETQAAVLKLVCYLLVFLLSFQICRDRGRQPALIGTLIALGVFEACYGTFQYLTGWQYIFAFAKKIYTDSGTGTYINRNHFAGLLEMVLPFVMARILIRNPSPDGGNHTTWKRALVSLDASRLLRDLVVFVLIAVGLVFSLSRMGIFAATLGVSVVSVIVFFQTRSPVSLITVGIILAISLAYSTWIGLSPVVERFETLERPASAEQDRMPIWREAASLIRDYPLFGTGLGTYRWVNLHYQTHQLGSRFEHAHNDYLEFAADVGIPAASVLFGGLWVLAVLVALKSRLLPRTNQRILATACAGAMVAMLTHEVVDFNLQIPANAFIFAWISGTAAALLCLPETGKETDAPSF